MATEQSGPTIDTETWPGILGQARTVAEALPDLLAEARQVGNSVVSGWHGRRRSGPGESFWQFRPFVMGEPAKRIDWRRSARDDHLYVREREWEAAHTIWLWADLTASMAFRSRLAQVTKRDRALVLLLAVADMLANTGERIGLPGLTRPFADRNAAERIADALTHLAGPVALPDTSAVRRFSDVVLIADFLDPIDQIAAWVGRVAGTGARGHLVQVLDPIEETFPFDGRVEFRDPEHGIRLTTGRAEGWREAYKDRLEAQKAGLKDIAARAGWTYILHHTDRPASEPLLLLHSRLSGAPAALLRGGE
ncbi:DUF58 domain-containing protein [Polymorphum gilvum]|uniref:DUF58 protein n=1 Tax=Polymorphum gilvum (strain LMG 25793 / CGMCC 1.9160 / SL003B-26A1) TaxID=991905 RepID=F2IZN1_POLGS|nr:DUF58 domain-containing protein [Polymorphum gilvum]ADZ69588.1 DUF58 protein [Polymorphum gilvum SL003B-26A1]